MRAKPSKRPSTIQFVMINPTKTESCLETSNKYALNIRSTKITIVAIIVISTIILIFLGMKDLIREITRLESAMITVTAMPITKDGFN